MSLQDQLMADLKEAMKAKDNLKKDTITLVRAAVKQREVDERTQLDEDQVLDLISKEVKTRRASIEEFKKGDRQDLVDKTQAEIDILLDYLPDQLTEDEVRAMVLEIIEEEGLSQKKDMGRLMKAIMPKIKGRADGKLVNKIGAEVLK